MDNREIIVNSSGRVCTITINRTERMNALNLTTLEKMSGIVQELQGDCTIGVVVITGAGNKAFCAGADLKDRAGMTPGQVRDFIVNIRDTFTAIESLPQPVIASINGLPRVGAPNRPWRAIFGWLRNMSPLGSPRSSSLSSRLPGALRGSRASSARGGPRN